MVVKKVFVLAILIFALIGFFLLKPRKFTVGPTIESSEIFNGVSYEPVDKEKYTVSILAQNLFSPTRLKITPDAKNLIVSQINGEILAFNKSGREWDQKPYLVTKVDTKFPGFPPDEAGLVGMVFSGNYSKNGKLFLLYTFKDKDGATQNRISVTTLYNILGKLWGTPPKMVWQANTPGAGSHQITDGIPVEINDESRILFLVGEGFNAKRSQNQELHAGKLISIKEDGSGAIIHAMGLRNGYVMAKNPFDPDHRMFLTDTGPDKYDRLIYTNPLLPGLLNFGWDGDQDDLANPVPDPNFKETKDMVILRLVPTKTFTGLAVTSSGEVLTTLFGSTGSKDNTPGKEILLGKLTNLDNQPEIAFETILKRVESAKGKLGNPIGLEIDPSTGDFFFADILEGKIYQVSTQGGE